MLLEVAPPRLEVRRVALEPDVLGPGREACHGQEGPVDDEPALGLIDGASIDPWSLGVEAAILPRSSPRRGGSCCCDSLFLYLASRKHLSHAQ